MDPIFITDEYEMQTYLQSLNSMLLDFDGTLVDYLENETLALVQMLRDFSVPEDLINPIIIDYKKINLSLWEQYEKKELRVEYLVVERFRIICEQYKISKNPKEMNDRYTKYFGEMVVPYPGLFSVLRDFNQKYPHIQMAILTNGTDDIQHRRANKAGIMDLMQTLVSSDKVGSAKPSPAIFDYIFQETSFDPLKSIMIGDSLTSDIKGANNYNLPSVLIKEDHDHNNDTQPSMVVDSLMTFLKYLDNVLTVNQNRKGNT